MTLGRQIRTKVGIMHVHGCNVLAKANAREILTFTSHAIQIDSVVIAGTRYGSDMEFSVVKLLN
jgi:hypothetical protein